MKNDSRRDARAAFFSGAVLAAIVTLSGGFTILSAHPGPVGDTAAPGKKSLQDIRHEAYCVDAIKRLAPSANDIQPAESPDAATRIIRFGTDGRNIARCEFLPHEQADGLRMERMSVNDKRLHRQVIDAINMRIDVLEFRRG